jgi:hypothetical protein
LADVNFIEYKGKEILHMDFSDSKKDHVLEAIRKGRDIIDKQPPNSVLGLVDVSLSNFDKDLAAALKEFSLKNKSFIKMSAIVGVTGIKSVIYRAVLSFTGRKNLILKDNIEDAKDWLIEQ